MNPGPLVLEIILLIIDNRSAHASRKWGRCPQIEFFGKIFFSRIRSECVPDSSRERVSARRKSRSFLAFLLKIEHQRKKKHRHNIVIHHRNGNIFFNSLWCIFLTIEAATPSSTRTEQNHRITRDFPLLDETTTTSSSTEDSISSFFVAESYSRY